MIEAITAAASGAPSTAITFACVLAVLGVAMGVLPHLFASKPVDQEPRRWRRKAKRARN